MAIKCIVIDDERLARQYIKNYISKIPELELLGDFNSPLKALDLIKTGEVDLMFIDIQMPDITGIEFVRSLENPPKVIFTTAYQEYALEGFELSAIDYLLKPFSFERFFQATNKVISNGIDETPKEVTFKDDFITIRADRRYYKINFRDIKYIEGQKAYVTFHTEKRKITALASLKDLEQKLPSSKFIRVHKSFIASIENISELEGNTIQVSETQIPIGSTYKERILTLFGIE